tara:strand:+ start:5322 stop:6242 length:921 start_codon:yes stop_codon:yes gene_type:complete
MTTLPKPVYEKVKIEYFKFLKSQEVFSEPFKDKTGQLNKFYIPISNFIFNNYNKKKKTIVIGLTGGQGSGKSTISNILKLILMKGFNLKTVIFSIDDFYKTLNQRKQMSKKVSPLFFTRGVPGTHDTKLLKNCINSLKKKVFKKILIPRFDKSKDERMPKKNWQKIKDKPQIVIFEGWCVNVAPQKRKDLLIPINKLEREKDKKRVWRERVNREIKNNYKKIFSLIDLTIFLRVPSFKYVVKWRLLQERKLRLRSRGKKTMTNFQIKQFVMFYERLTKHMSNSLTKTAKFVIDIDKKHRLKKISIN